MRRHHQAVEPVQALGRGPAGTPGFDVTRDQKVRRLNASDPAYWLGLQHPPAEQTLPAPRAGQLLPCSRLK